MTTHPRRVVVAIPVFSAVRTSIGVKNLVTPNALRFRELLLQALGFVVRH